MISVEQLARRIAARKMGLILDPLGGRLPKDLWQQCLPEAQAQLEQIAIELHGEDAEALATTSGEHKCER